MRISLGQSISVLLAGASALFVPTLASAQTNTGQKEVTKQEWERRIKVCFRSEEWLGPVCIAELNTYEVIEDQKGADATSSSTAPTTSVPVDEMHIVGIHEATTVVSRDGTVRRGEVPVRVDRPGSTVALVLNSSEPVSWLVEATPNTQIGRIVVSGRGAEQSEVTFNADGVLVSVEEIGSAYRLVGVKFHKFHRAARELLGVENAASFQGAYKAPIEGFEVFEVPGVPTLKELQARLIEQAIDPNDLSTEMRDALSSRASSYEDEWKFGNEGFERVDKNGQLLRFNLPLEFPSIESVIGSAYDPNSQTIWGMTRGIEGNLYEYDISRDKWSVRRINGFDDFADVGGLLFDEETGHIVMTPGRFNPRYGQFLVVDRNANKIASIEIPYVDFPGLVHTFNPDNGPLHFFKPLLVEDGKILLRAISPAHIGSSSFAYLVDLGTGAVRLIRD